MENPKTATQEWVKDYVNATIAHNDLTPLPSEKSDLSITSIQYDGATMRVFIHSDTANINPYRVLIEEETTGHVVRHARNVPHTNAEKPLEIPVFLPYGENVRILVQSETAYQHLARAIYLRLPKTEPPKVVQPNDAAPVVVVPDLYFNTTGYGYEPSSPHSIAPEMLERALDWQKVGGADYIRIHVRWQDWEPMRGQYTELMFLQFVKKMKLEGFGIAVCVRPYRNDNLIEPRERATDHLGRVFNNGGYHTFSLGAVNAQDAFRRSMVRFHDLLNTHAPDTKFSSMGYGAAEEFHIPYFHDNGTITGMAMFSDSDRALYRELYGEELPVYDTNWFPDSLGAYYRENNSVLHYITSRLRVINRNFAQSINYTHQDSKIMDCGFYASLGTGHQSAWEGMRNLPMIYAGSKAIYSSEGSGRDLHKKLMVADFHTGTFPDAYSIIEYDPDDCGQEENFGPIKPEQVFENASEAVRRGVKGICWAMTFTRGEMLHGKPTTNQLGQLHEVIKTLKAGIALPPPVSPVVINYRATLYSEQEQYYHQWQQLEGDQRPVPFQASLK